MTTRYGDKTELNNPVPNWGRGAGGSGADYRLYEEVFTSPGTWTKPLRVTGVEVIVVGGGGGGSDSGPGSAVTGAGGGGGGVRYGWVPVTGPVPVTVGAGGVPAKTVPAAGVGAPGGSSAFGPLAPGYPYPSTTIVVGGGFGGNGEANTNEEHDLGGGAGGKGPPTAQLTGRRGGNYGGDTTSRSYNPTGPSWSTVGAAGAGGDSDGLYGGVGLLGYGYGAPSETGPRTTIRGQFGAGTPVSLGTVLGEPDVAATPGVANTGGGGGAGASPTGPTPAPGLTPLLCGGSGGSGIVIVRYWA